MDSDTRHNSPPPIDFNPDMYLEDLDVELQFEKMVAEMQPTSSATSAGFQALPEFNLEEILGLSGLEDPVPSYNPPSPGTDWEELFSKQSDIDLDTNDMFSEFTNLDEDAEFSDLFNGDIDMTDFCETSETAPWISTSFSGDEAVLTQSPSTIIENCEAQSSKLPESDLDPTDFDLTVPSNADAMLLNQDNPVPTDDPFLDADLGLSTPERILNNDINFNGIDDLFSEFDFNDFEFPGLDQPGNSFFNPQSIQDSPSPPFLPSFPAQSAPLVPNNAVPPTGKGRFFLLKNGQTVLSVPPEGLGTLLNGLSNSGSTVELINQRPGQMPATQGLSNAPLPDFNFQYSETVDGSISNNGPVPVPSWKRDIDNLLPPPRPATAAASQQVARGAGVPSGTPIPMTKEQERKLARVMADVPRRNRALLDRAQKPKQSVVHRYPEDSHHSRHYRERSRAVRSLSPESESDYSRHVRAARRHVQVSKRVQFENARHHERTRVPGRERERTQAEIARERALAHERERDERARKRDQASRRPPTSQSEKARAQATRMRERWEKEDPGHSYREALSLSPSPTPPPARSAARHTGADRCAVRRSDRVHRSDRPDHSDCKGDRRPLTRRYARQHGVSLQSPDFSS